MSYSLLFETLVRPHLEYGNLVWGLFDWTDQHLVERVQQQTTWLVEYIQHNLYEKRLHHLDLLSITLLLKAEGRYDPCLPAVSWRSWCRPGKLFMLMDKGHPFKIQKFLVSSRADSHLHHASLMTETGSHLMWCVPHQSMPPRLYWKSTGHQSGSPYLKQAKVAKIMSLIRASIFRLWGFTDLIA